MNRTSPSSASPALSDPALAERLSTMIARFRELGRAVVAYSGGVDSTLALKVGTLAIGAECIGVTARSETLTDDDFELTSEIARAHGMRQEVIEYSELEIENYADNPVNRCYFCKRELYSRVTALLPRFDAKWIVDGSNLDDVGDYRPGAQAAGEHGVVSVLREAGMTKDDVRRMARELGLSNWDKPAAPCLASRVPYGERIDAVKLSQIARGEAFLRGLGFRQVRLRHHDKIARLEVEPAEIARLAEEAVREEVVRFLRSIGFRWVSVDLAGYRTGSLNDGIAAVANGVAPQELAS